MRCAALALTCLLLGVLAGCGRDDERSADTETATTPAVTAPSTTETPAATAPPPPASTPEAPPDPAGGGGARSGGTTAPSPAPRRDSPENDLRPPPGSPAERFERECDANPDGCG